MTPITKYEDFLKVVMDLYNIWGCVCVFGVRCVKWSRFPERNRMVSPHITGDDTQHEKSRTLIRKENIKFEYKFEIRISKNLTIAYHIKFLKCRSSWFFSQHLFRIFDTNTWIHFVIFSYSTIPLVIINIPIKILVITHTWCQTEKSWRLLLNCEFRELCAQMYNFC